MSELKVTDLTVTFAGITALDRVGFTVAPGSIHAIIGPNGAGKSTCFNVLSGVYKATSGSVRFGDAELTRMPPHKIAALGVARTFQNIALSRFQSVEDNVMLGRHRLMRAGFLGAGLRLPYARREDARHRARVRDIARFVGVAEYLDAPVGMLPYGVQKRVELARALAMEPTLLLLDEPVAGMNGAERRAMAEVIVAARADLGVSILLVEHDMGMVMRLADHVTVLDFGRKIASGPPQAVQNDPEVIRAYLGAQAVQDEAGKQETTVTAPAGGAHGEEPAGTPGEAVSQGVPETSGEQA